MKSSFNLNRFLDAQTPIFDLVLKELRQEQKESHWMWFIFPQIQGLGRSSTSHFYAIKNAEEAAAYVQHPVLRKRLMQVAELLEKSAETRPERIFGAVDAEKLQSSLTLFSLADPREEIFGRLLQKFYQGKRCSYTLEHFQ